MAVFDGIQLQRLQNGMPALIVPVPNKVVTIDCWVNAGSGNESDADNGVTHFLEHMLFKGTTRYKVGDLDKAIMNVGGVWNAATSKDFTHYHVTVAAPFFDKALDAISDMLQNALIDADEFAREKQVILEEWRRKQDSPWGFIFDELYDAAFEGGPYRRSVLGSFESISALDRDGMYRYYRDHYSPDTMFLMVVGDVDPAEVRPKLESAFPKNGSRGGNGVVRPAESASSSNFRAGGKRSFERDVREMYLAMAWPAPAITDDKGVLAMDLAQTLLGDGRSSRLYRILKEEKRLVNMISAGFPTHRESSLFYVYATLDSENLDGAVSETHKVLRGLATSPPSLDEMAKAKRILRNTFLFGMETNTGRSGLIGYYYTITGSMEFLETYLDRLAAMTPEDVAAAARQFFEVEPTMVTLQPKKAASDAVVDAGIAQ